MYILFAITNIYAPMSYVYVWMKVGAAVCAAVKWKAV